jgi:hypothetical protein
MTYNRFYQAQSLFIILFQYEASIFRKEAGGYSLVFAKAFVIFDKRDEFAKNFGHIGGVYLEIMLHKSRGDFHFEPTRRINSSNRASPRKLSKRGST